MAHIGQFIRTQDGFAGCLKTLSLDLDIRLTPTEPSEADTAPDYRVVIGSDDEAGDYVSVLIDDPMLPRPINANLFRSLANSSSFLLVWNRPAKRRDGA
jgi:uncharacterized protein (DUF736 family)